MSNVYQAPNGRIIARDNSGKFTKMVLSNRQFNLAAGPAKCTNCGHEFQPVLKTGKCPKCDEQLKAQ